MDKIFSQMQNQNNDLQIAGPITSTSTTLFSSPSSSPPFELPSDWVFELRRRKCNGRFDKYYYEPGTGRQFRSLSSIQKYLSGDINSLPKRLKRRNRENMAIVPCIFERSPSFRLPDGWVVKEKPRNNINYAHVVDRTYIEPGTGKRFRSLISVERYIAEGKLFAATPRPHQLYLTDMAEASNLRDHGPSSSFCCETKRACGNKVEASILDLGRPPANVKWVLSPVGSIWKPFMNDTLVPDSLKRKWSQASVNILSCAH